MDASIDNLSVVIHKKNDLRVEQTELPLEPGPYEVQLASNTVGICGSDIHFWKDGCIDKWVIEEPIVTGHESSATVVKVGSYVKNLKVGDRVSVEPGVGCMSCSVCKDGFYNLCPDVLFHAVPPTGGSLRRYYNHSSAFCHKLPDNMSYAEGALMEPLAVGVYACKRAAITEGSGQRVMVTGAGPVGLLAAMAAKALGAQDVCILDINEERLKFAQRMGITKTLLVNTTVDTEGLAKEVTNLLGGNSPDITLECSGAESSLNLAIYVTKDGGNVVMVGLNHQKVCVSLSSAACREVNLLGIKRYRHSFPLAIYLVSSGKLDVKPLITHTYTIENAVEAFETASSLTSGAIKVQILCFQGA